MKIWAAVLLLPVSADPWLSESCAAVRRAHGLNFTKLQSLAWKHYRQGKSESFMEASLDPELLRVAKDTWALQAAVRDVKACPVALLVAAGIMLLYEVKFSNSLRTNLDYEEHFHRMSLYQREVLDNLKMIKDVLDGLWWPVRETVQMQGRLVVWLENKVDKSKPHWDPEEGQVVTDEAHLQALQDVKDVMEEVGIEDWFPYSGTLVALLRHGQRSGPLSHGKRDVVDHDVDVLVGVPSEAAWVLARWSINLKLRAKGWDRCFGRTSVDAPDVRSTAYRLAREDLMLCSRQNPTMILDLGSYIIGEGSVVYCQKFCDHLGCYIPHVGTFGTGKGVIRKTSIYPMARCKAGHFSVPCPRKPLDVLRVVMPGWNFTEHCLALPDVALRQQRGYEDDEIWSQEVLQQEDVEILQLRAAELQQEGYLSMSPYFSGCRLP